MLHGAGSVLPRRDRDLGSASDDCTPTASSLVSSELGVPARIVDGLRGSARDGTVANLELVVDQPAGSPDGHWDHSTEGQDTISPAEQEGTVPTASFFGLAHCAASLALDTCLLRFAAVASLDEAGRAHTVVWVGSQIDPGPPLLLRPPMYLASQILSRRTIVSTRWCGTTDQDGNGLPNSARADHHMFDPESFGVIAVPVTCAGRVRGFLYGARIDGAGFDPDQTRRLSCLTTMLGASWTGWGSTGNSWDRTEREFGVTMAAHSQQVGREPTRSNGRADGTSNSRNRCVAEIGPELTDREMAILHLLAEGMSTKQIAAHEYLAVNSVRTYIQSMLHKLGCTHRLQAVAFARTSRLI